jgi:pentatricopeptide repeat protein
MSDSDWNRRKRELRHLQDPLELAEFVKAELRKDKVEEMLQLVRMASHSMESVVSWNHIIDHYLAKERVNDALKVYNDVCLVYARMAIEVDANGNLDEEACAVPRFVYLLDPATRPRE